MASIDKRPDGRYRARWREYPNGPQRTKTFTRKRDAELFLADVQHRLLAGTYTTPEAGKITVSAYAEEWLHRRHWAASTAESVERMLRLHILPELGRWPLAGLRRAHIEQWAAALPLAPSSVRTLHRTLSSLLASAVEDERIPRNPASRGRLPKVVDEQVVPMTVDEVRALTGAMVEHVRAAVVVAAGTARANCSGSPWTELTSYGASCGWTASCGHRGSGGRSSLHRSRRPAAGPWR